MQNNRHFLFLLKANLKQNSWRHLSWLLILGGLFASAAAKFNVLFGATKDIAAITKTLKTPAMVALFGEFPTDPPYTTANVFAAEMLVFMAMFMAFMNISLAIRNTRVQEETGVLEMVRSRSVGRSAALSAALSEIIGLNLVMGVFYVGSLIFANLNGATLLGDILFGMSLALAGIFFGCSSLLIAQLVSSSRSAYFISYSFFGICYILRMITDVSKPAWTWLSPLGWVQKTYIYTQNDFWPLVLLTGSSLLLVGLAFHLASTRDINSGLLADRPGKAQAGKFLRSPLALVMRTEKNSLIGWLLGAVILGVCYGSIFNTIGDIIGTNPTYKKMLGVTQIDTANRQLILNFLNMLVLFFIALAVVAGLLVCFRLKSDEQKGYLELLHAKAITKTKLAVSYFSVGWFSSLLVYTGALAGSFFTGNALLNQPIPLKFFWRMLLTGFPAVLFFLGCGIFLIGWLPKFTNVLWLYLAGGLLVKFFGPLLNLSEKSGNFSPFGWVGKIPLTKIDTGWFIILVAGFVLLSLGGVIGYTKRDLR